ncbi:hypothetical protein ASD62_12610 [Phycicoccus sp. Root563]|uniref:hypothetical protein n=1 Tax=Phycicoccus sp. Root563 TaxID=1736562 RepID=UPI0007036627|nr:hypothetical protein [Phycicoccus sp. Root563]KQZ90013.1 hypothetical protein ASD62_12610 [Phycicoccus sp. Root563]
MKTSRAAHASRVALTAVLVGALAVGCGGRTCDTADASNLLRVTVAGFPRALDSASAGPDLVTVQVCLATTCTSAEFDGGRGNSVGMELPFTSTEPVDLSILVSGTTGVLLSPATVRVTPRSFSPNGPGCDPTVYRAELTVTPAEPSRP